MNDTTGSVTMDAEQNALVDAYLSAFSSDDPKAKMERSRLSSKLDGIYWKRVELLLRNRVDPTRETLDFTPDERLLIDMGLLDERLVANADGNLREKLWAELNHAGPAQHFYFSEWLEDRYRRFCMTERMSEQAAAQEEEISPEEQARGKVLSRLAPLFDGLAGVSPELSQFMVSGRLDKQLVQSGIDLLESVDRRSFVHRSRIRRLRSQMVRKARSRSSDPAVGKLFDMLEDLYARQWRQAYASYSAGEKKNSSSALMRAADAKVRDKRADFLVGEMSFAKTLLPLGALAGGLTRTTAVLFADEPRVTKTQTHDGLQRAHLCDRGYSEDPVVLIAPFSGRGIFEWDRDSLVISLRPVENGADSVANAAANFRMLTDSLQKDGALRAAYEAAFPGTNFQKSFQSDYRAWVTRCGGGEVDALDAAHVAFFLRHVGPDAADGIIIPTELKTLTPAALSMVGKRLEKQVQAAVDDAGLRYRFAAVLWLLGQGEAALRHLALAAKNAPAENPVLLSLGLALRGRGEEDKAKEFFGACLKRCGGTLWALYARAALAGELPVALAEGGHA